MIRMQVGQGYGPIFMTFDVDDFTADQLIERVARRGVIPLFTYCPSAGNELDLFNARYLHLHVPRGWWEMSHNWATAYRTFYVAQQDRKGVEDAVQVLSALLPDYGNESLCDDEWLKHRASLAHTMLCDLAESRDIPAETLAERVKEEIEGDFAGFDSDGLYLYDEVLIIADTLADEMTDDTEHSKE